MFFRDNVFNPRTSKPIVRIRTLGNSYNRIQVRIPPACFIYVQDVDKIWQKKFRAEARK